MHKFKLGQILEVIPSPRTSTRAAGPCKVLALLPFEGHAVQYRVQSINERNERIVSETDLRPSSASIPARSEAESHFKRITIGNR